MANTHLEAHAQPHLYTNGAPFGFNLDQQYAINQEMMLQRDIQSAQLLSPTQRPRHDSLFDMSPSASPKAGFSPQQCQAVAQPCVSSAQPTSFTLAQYPVNMQRSGSHYSTASNQHHQQVRQQHFSFDYASQPGTVVMSRTSTQQSGQSLSTQCQPKSQPRGSTATFAQGYGSLAATHSPIAFESQIWSYAPTRTNGACESTLTDVLEGNAFDLKGMGQRFGRDIISTESQNHRTIATQPPRLRHASLNQDPCQKELTPVPADDATVSSSSRRSRSPAPLARRRRRCISSPSVSDPSDPVIGQVTATGKFKCLATGCTELTFGRQADFRRHWENCHAPKKIEYFCPVDGCGRSKRPTSKSKGRSFGARDDKMREHCRTVHEKVGKRKREVLEKDGGEDDEGMSAGSGGDQEREKKKMSMDSAHESQVWAGTGGC